MSISVIRLIIKNKN